MIVSEPTLLDLEGIGKFRIAGSGEAQPRWSRKRIQTPDGMFSRLRTRILTSPADGITGSHRYAGRGVGVANLKNANGTRYGTFGAGPKVTAIALTAQAGANVNDTPATIADDATVGAITWGTPTNAGASDDAYATAAVGTSHYLEGRMGASAFALPANAIVKGIQLDVEKKRNQLSSSENASPGTLASDSAVGTRPWSNPGNAAASDDSDATALATGGDEVTEYLKATNFGLSVPSTATILGVKVQIERASSAGATTGAATLAGTGVSSAAYGATPWTDPTNIQADDDARATAVGGTGNSISQYLRASNFGFAIDADANIVGIEATVNRSVVESSADSGASAPVTAASDPAVGTDPWVNPGNAVESNDTYATVAAAADIITEYLKLTNYGFAIPSDATIDGIEVSVERNATQGGAPAYRAAGAGAFQGGGGNGHTIDVPTGTPVEGELMVTYLRMLGDVSIPSVTTVPSGWTSLGTVTQTTSRFSAYGKIAGASEPSTYQWIATESGGTPLWLFQGQTFLIENVKNEMPTLTDFESTSGPTTLDKAAVTTTIDNSTVFDFVDIWTGAKTFTKDAATTADLTSADGELITELVHVVKTTAGSVAARAHTIGAASAYISFVLEVKPLQATEVTDQTVRLVDADGTVVGDNNADTGTGWPEADTAADYGGAADDWSASLTADDVNDIDFGVVISADVPDGAIASIDAVTITIHYTTTVSDDRVRIVTALASIGAEEKAAAGAWPTSEATKTYGGAADLWGESWSPTQINDIDFGIVIAADLGEGATARVDWIKIAITFELAGVIDSVVKLVVSGAVEGDSKAIAALWPDADAVQDYGGETDVWGTATTLTPAIVNASTFGVVLSAVATDTVTASVDHIQVTVFYSTSVVDNSVRLLKAGVYVGDDKAQASDWGAADAVVSYGGANDLWGTTWADTEVEAATFGAGISCVVAGGAEAHIDHFTLTVYYSVDGEPAHVSKIFAHGPDSIGGTARYVYAVAGSNMHVIDPVTDTEVVIDNYPATVDGGDAAFWGGEWWIALRGVSTDFVKRMSGPYNGVLLTTADTDFTASAIEAGPDALYRAYNDFGTPENKALVQKSTSPDPADVDEVVNWAPTNGEQMGDPGISVTRMRTLGERLVVGKEDGVGELDADFTFRSYLRWMQQFRWTLNINGLVPLGQAGDFIATFRRGLWLLPANRSIGVEGLQSNDTNKRGRYTALTTDGKWLYAALWNPDPDDSTSGVGSLLMMQPRRNREGPGIYEHHPILELTDGQILDIYVWPGAEIDGTIYPPRLYFGGGLSTLNYIVLGETQPMESADGVTFTDDWEIEWPEDNFGDPATIKRPYSIESTYRGVSGTEGVEWQVHVGQDPHDGGGEGEHESGEHAHHWLPLTSDGTDNGDTGVVEDGFHQRFGKKDGSEWGRHIGYKAVGSGGGLAVQQRVTGDVVIKYFEQPETVAEVAATLVLDSTAQDYDGEEAYRRLEQAQGTLVQATLVYGDDDGDAERATVYIPAVELSAAVVGSDQQGTQFASVLLNLVDFDDEFDPTHPH